MMIVNNHFHGTEHAMCASGELIELYVAFLLIQLTNKIVYDRVLWYFRGSIVIHTSDACTYYHNDTV